MGACCQPKPIEPQAPACCHAPRPDASGPAWWKLGLCLVLAGLNMTFGINLDREVDGVREIQNFSPVYWGIHGFLLTSSVVAFALLGWPLMTGAWQTWRRRQLTLESLFLLSAFGALVLSAISTFTGRGSVYYDVIPVVLAIYTFGSLLGERSRGQANAALAALRTTLDTVTVVGSDGAPQRQARSALQEGQRVAVLAGETVPVDGTVTSGSATVVEAAVTGEPFPVAKHVGDRVFAGSVIADDGYLQIAPDLTKASRMDGVLDAVVRSLDAPTRIHRDADALLRWFLPFVVIAGVLTYSGWAYYGHFEKGLRAMLAVYLVACPCALGLATPVAVMSALHRLGRIGLAPSSGDTVLKLAEVDTVVLDKTGTLGEGLPTIEGIHLNPSATITETDLRQKIAAVESRARHPLAAALVQLAAPVELSGLKVETQSGLGVVGKWDTGELRIGERDLMPASADFSFADSLTGKRVWVALDGRAVAVVILCETLRVDARATVQALHKLGLSVEVLTGDRSPAWTSIEGAKITSGLSPAGKAARVRAMNQAGHKVLFVGDGLNDLEGMSDAHATLAMASGADLTQHSCDAVVVVDRLATIPESIQLCRKVRRDLKVNLWISTGYNFVGIGLAAAGLLAPWVAALVMLSSSLLVAARAVRSASHDAI